MTRREFPLRLAGAALAARWTEPALAQRALVAADVPANTVWLNANENPEGPCPAALEAMAEVLGRVGRYHYQHQREFLAAVARSEGLEPEQVLIGAGSSEILQTAVYAFTAPDRPLISPEPTFELPAGIARALGHPVIAVPLTQRYTADVERLVAEAGRAGGGLIYLCNPNNPTSTITPKSELAWLVENLPPRTVLLVDEAYIHFSEDPELESAIGYVCQGREVIVARTFSKIYGLAGLRVGFGCARPDLIARLGALRSNVVSWVSARAVMASLAQLPDLLVERRRRVAALRSELCRWLAERGFSYLEPHANFVMIDLGRNVREVIPELVRRGVAPGRPFPPLRTFLRVSIGTPAEMETFRRVFSEVMAT
jgi:histidinol-phosphate aminotransferase